VAAGLISSIAAIGLLDLRHADLRVPFEYKGDALLYSSVIKSIIDHGWFWRNPSLGAPGGLQLYDYPNVAHEVLHLSIIKVMSAFSRDWALLLNVYFLLGFPLIALSAVAVLRRLRIGEGPAIVASVLYSFLPTRLLKGEGHVFLDGFFQVPLAVWLLLWVCGDAPHAPDERLRRRRAIAALLICGLCAGTSAYYSFFTICLLVAGGLWASIERRSPRNAIAGAALALTIIAAMGALGLPSMAYHRTHGPNPEVGRRTPAEAEVYGLKITQLLLPADGHRVQGWRSFKQQYNSHAPLIGENTTTSLGLVGSFGFLALLGAMFVRRRPDRADDDDRLRSLATLNLGAVLLGTVGGFGALFAFAVYPQIRAYSRVAVVIGFLSLAAVALLLDRLTRARPRLGALALLAMLLGGLVDQTTPLAVRPNAQAKESFASDRGLIRAVEARVPPGSLIFQLPYVMFPEGPAVQQLKTNDLLRPYLHSTSLRWSQPTMHGRSGEAFVLSVIQLPAIEMIDRLAATGFGGILINRDGYADHGAAIEAALRDSLAAEALASADGRLAFFDLAGHHGRAAPLSPAELDRVLHPITVGFSAGFHALERSPSGTTFRWCGPRGEIYLDNEGRWPRRLSVRAALAAARPPARLSVDGDLLAASVELVEPVAFAHTLDVAPGHHVIRFASDGRPAEAPGDPRVMVWRLEELAFDELPLDEIPRATAAH
jgi:phosphoglycerol transferase